MADSVFKQWDDKIDSLVNDDFKKGVMTAIRQLKEEVYNMKVDNLNQSMGRVIRDDKRIVLSAPEIIIGDVNLGGILNPEGYSKVTIRGYDVSLQGAGDMGQVDMRAPIISQVAENPGCDGNEHVIGDVSTVFTQACNITVQSDTVKPNGTFPAPDVITKGGIRLISDHQVDVMAMKGNKSRVEQIDKSIRQLENSKPRLEDNVKQLSEEYKALREEIDKFFKKKESLAKDGSAIRTDYIELDELNIRIEELSVQLSEIIYKYSDALSVMGENARMLAYFKKQKDEASKMTDEKFQKNSIRTSVSIIGEEIDMASMDADGNLRTNKKAGVNIMSNKMLIGGALDDKGELKENNALTVNMRKVEVTTAGMTNLKLDDKDEVETAKYQAVGDFIVRSKNITLESVDYEVAEKKLKESGLTADGNIKIRSKKIDLSTVNASDVEVDDKGKVTKAKYTAEGDITVNSKTFTLTATDGEQEGENVKETALTKDSTFAIRTEKIDFAATDTEGKATGKVNVNAKNIQVKAMDVDKEKRTDSKLAEGSKMLLLSEKMYVGAKSEDVKSKSIQTVSEEIALFADKTFEAQQADAKAFLQLSDGNATISGSKSQIYGETTINANTEVKGEFKSPKAAIDNLEAKFSFKSPNISDGMSAGAGGGGGKAESKTKAENAPEE